MTQTLPSLAQEAWLNEPRLQRLFAVLSETGGEGRVAGGAVRNALLGVAIADIDMATTLTPQQVMLACRAAGFAVHPTGIDHGTVTVVVERQPFEVTSLRQDVATDGRHAQVAFTSDWMTDALRRDFTMNALYCDAHGKLYDYTNGYRDLLARRINFVGDAAARIREDYLRILRFFRFHARFGEGRPDERGLAACVALKAGIAGLSAERIRQELLKLLEAPGAVPTLMVMAESGILAEIIPFTEQFAVLERLPRDGILRLAVLAAEPEQLKSRLRLANEEAARIMSALNMPDVAPDMAAHEQRVLLYARGAQAWEDGVDISWALSGAAADDGGWRALRDLPERWITPRLPVTGQDLVGLGIPPGPLMGRTLRRLEQYWLDHDFAPTRRELLALAKEGKDG